jgi:hypothetical protein
MMNVYLWDKLLILCWVIQTHLMCRAVDIGVQENGHTPMPVPGLAACQTSLLHALHLRL